MTVDIKVDVTVGGYSGSKTLYLHTWTNPLMIVPVRPPLAATTAITTATRPTTAWERAPAHNVVLPQQSSTSHWQQIKAIPSIGRPVDTQTHQWCSQWIQRWMQTRWSRGWELPVPHSPCSPHLPPVGTSSQGSHRMSSNDGRSHWGEE